MSIIFTDKLFYDRTSSFTIMPIFNEEDSKQFIIYIEKLRIKYKMVNNCESYFWNYDVIGHRIIINENIDVVDEDIFNQLYLISRWLFNRGYNLDGICYLRMGNMIEKIEVRYENKLIIHQIMFDNFPYHILTDNLVNKQQVNEYILDKSKEKIDQQTVLSNCKSNTDGNQNLYEIMGNINNQISTINIQQKLTWSSMKKVLTVTIVVCALSVCSLFHPYLTNK